ncbi:Rv3654c family TadE-like protein [Kineococcus rhizosphaerae]|uniref:Secretion/DNA translocation related TadE-like protein n=1 Tax=Kineococcus rhizosphaerae TaxID=559628 RepID=A0A2T0R5P6_9ACTN|nr:Rv3654c family TadE-like protein [Kineococcus rhizosphaerae]PRY16080.1 secretion/DNA translocation related TadE-like protein [Kineococcus rhizosphaerae]
MTVVTAVPGGGEEGSGSVLAVGTCAALLSALLLVLALASAVVARHRAEAAADLAALAAADVVVGRAAGRPCARAATVAAAQGAELSACAVAGDGTVAVTALVRPAGVAGRFGAARASARAGQATSGEAG